MLSILPKAYIIYHNIYSDVKIFSDLANIFLIFLVFVNLLILDTYETTQLLFVIFTNFSPVIDPGVKNHLRINENLTLLMLHYIFTISLLADIPLRVP